MTSSSKPIPNLFIVGAMKSGTTSLHNYLNKHRQIFMSDLKEPGYFVEEINWNRGEEWYLSLFDDVRIQHRYWGESSTDYTKLPRYQGVPERIKAFNPQAKIIFIMRDPFARIVSHYWFAVRHISTGGLRQDFYTACTRDPRYIDFSNYPMQIRPYLKLFGKMQVKLVLFEDLLREPQALIREILEWLELEYEVDDDIFGKAWNARPDQILGVSGLGILNKIAYSKSWDHISPHIPKSLKSWATRLSKKTLDPQDQQTHIERLRVEIRSDLLLQTEAMSEIMGRDLKQVWKL